MSNIIPPLQEMTWDELNCIRPVAMMFPPLVGKDDKPLRMPHLNIRVPFNITAKELTRKTQQQLRVSNARKVAKVMPRSCQLIDGETKQAITEIRANMIIYVDYVWHDPTELDVEILWNQCEETVKLMRPDSSMHMLTSLSCKGDIYDDIQTFLVHYIPELNHTQMGIIMSEVKRRRETINENRSALASCLYFYCCYPYFKHTFLI
jgi:hypothetical protein